MIGEFWKNGEDTPFFEYFPKEIHRIANFGSVSYRGPHQNHLFFPSVSYNWRFERGKIQPSDFSDWIISLAHMSAYTQPTHRIFGMVKDVDNIYYCTKNQMRGFCVGGDGVRQN